MALFVTVVHIPGCITLTVVHIPGCVNLTVMGTGRLFSPLWHREALFSPLCTSRVDNTVVHIPG